MFFLDILFPKRCVGCGRVGWYFCNTCRRTIRYIRPNEAVCPVCERLALDGKTHPKCRGLFVIDGLLSFFRYDGIIRKAVKTLKYRKISDITKEFVEIIPITSYNIIFQYLDRQSCVLVPVPLHPNRFRLRGFNQAERLARQMSEVLEIPVRTDILARIRYTEPQVSMEKRQDRLKNMNGVFRIHPFAISHLPFTVILIDDVFTTGATMRSAAHVLKRAGVKTVWGLTMAR